MNSEEIVRHFGGKSVVRPSGGRWSSLPAPDRLRPRQAAGSRPRCSRKSFCGKPHARTAPSLQQAQYRKHATEDRERLREHRAGEAPRQARLEAGKLDA